MTDLEHRFVEACKELRKLQDGYFKHKVRDARKEQLLKECKKYERGFDKSLVGRAELATNTNPVIVQLYNKVKDMRTKQNIYYTGGGRKTDLNKATTAEAVVDHLLKTYGVQQTKLRI